MEILHSMFNLRDLFYRLRRKYQRRPTRVYTYHDGLPQGIDADTLATVCKERFGKQVQSVRYTHLSGWKTSGAYRLRVLTSSGPDIYMIFKLANYEHDEIPALRDFPLHPGLPEYIVYSQPVGPLAQYLPEIILAEEIQPQKIYRYLLEDLYQGYRIARGDDLRIQASRLLPELHEALRAWSVQANTEGLLNYGRQFSEQLQEYVRTKLERYSQINASPVLRSVLASWPGISEMHLMPEFFTFPKHMIHGDANFSNFHISRSSTRNFKIVDWEWAGFGSPYADLAALMKSNFEDLERRGYENYYRHLHLQDIDRRKVLNEHYRQFLWNRLERAMTDAAFLAAQVLDTSRETRVNLRNSVDQALLRIQTCYHQLSS